ncbi:hypothetical protein [Scardovia wiggsiae]|mgnify:FL=1|uniref:hypothetical protein n=1 Tax=Scardovia wiggsiae TaxID=230143 RepID=UPI00374E820A
MERTIKSSAAAAAVARDKLGDGEDTFTGLKTKKLSGSGEVEGNRVHDGKIAEKMKGFMKAWHELVDTDKKNITAAADALEQADRNAAVR